MSELERRATVHAALGDRHRLQIVDMLAVGDHTVSELATAGGLPGNLLAHHLDVLDSAGLIGRRVSEGDRRRRYVTLNTGQLIGALSLPVADPQTVLFVCTHNSARSQFAAALWSERTGQPAMSAGAEPADRVHPLALRAAAEKGIDLSAATPMGYESVGETPDLVVSVCDRAREAALPAAPAHMHWSIPDPVPSESVGAFRTAFTDIERRVDRLAQLTETNKEQRDNADH